METKLSKLKQFMAAGEFSRALRLAASFPRLGGHKEVISRAREADVRPEFYRSIGKDPASLVAAGLDAIRERYGLGIGGVCEEETK